MNLLSAPPLNGLFSLIPEGVSVVAVLIVVWWGLRGYRDLSDKFGDALTEVLKSGRERDQELADVIRDLTSVVSELKGAINGSNGGNGGAGK